MADIRKRIGKQGVTYQVRYPNAGTKSGYAYETFSTRKEALAFVESGNARAGRYVVDASIRTVPEAIERWLDICEKEGRDGRDPVTAYTVKTYERRAEIMKAYGWQRDLKALAAPDVVAFRSWLLRNYSRDLARKTLSSFHSVIKEMALRGHMASNVAAGISIRAESRYDTPVVIPTQREVAALLRAVDRLANSKNRQIAKTWERYRPIMYLAADSGMRPQEYLVVPKANIENRKVKVDRALERGGEISVTKTPAGRRLLDLSPETYEMVRYYADNKAIENRFDLVFPTASGRWQETDNWRKRGFYRACEEAGLIEEVEDDDGQIIEKPKYSPYDLRHFYASVLIDQRVNLKRIQYLMGHEDIKTTLNVYGHLIERAESSESEAFSLVSHIADTSCGKSVATLC